jgi:hypothetical protein
VNRDFAEMLSALSEAGAEYLLVGAHALAVHGFPRATGDLDLWIRPSPENALRVMAALRRFGAPLHDLTAQDLEQPGMVYQPGLPPRRIDLLTAISGVTFEEAWAARTATVVEGLTLQVLGREELLRNKRATGRPKDLEDVANLEGGAPGGRAPPGRRRRPRAVIKPPR